MHQMSQQNEDTRARLLDRVRAALMRLNNADEPDDATLAQLVPLFENAASIVQSSGHHVAGSCRFYKSQNGVLELWLRPRWILGRPAMEIFTAMPHSRIMHLHSLQQIPCLLPVVQYDHVSRKHRLTQELGRPPN